jgi:cyclase
MKRIIPVVLISNGRVVLSRNFSRHSVQGNPKQILDRLLAWDSDEVILLDISRNNDLHSFRSEINYCEDFNAKSDLLSLTSMSSKLTMTPLSVGGKVTNLTQIEKLLSSGADKVVINSCFFTDLKFCKRAIKEFGGSTIVASVDYKLHEGKFKVFIKNGLVSTNMELIEYCRKISELGISEILVNSIDRDGLGNGFDMVTINEIVTKLDTPIIACGGAGSFTHFSDIFQVEGLSGAAAANIFHFKENSMYHLKKNLWESGYPVRKARLRF